MKKALILTVTVCLFLAACQQDSGTTSNTILDAPIDVVVLENRFSIDESLGGRASASSDKRLIFTTQQDVDVIPSDFAPSVPEVSRDAEILDIVKSSSQFAMLVRSGDQYRVVAACTESPVATWRTIDSPASGLLIVDQVVYGYILSDDVFAFFPSSCDCVDGFSLNLPIPAEILEKARYARAFTQFRSQNGTIYGLNRMVNQIFVWTAAGGDPIDTIPIYDGAFDDNLFQISDRGPVAGNLSLRVSPTGDLLVGRSFGYPRGEGGSADAARYRIDLVDPGTGTKEIWLVEDFPSAIEIDEDRLYVDSIRSSDGITGYYLPN